MATEGEHEVVAVDAVKRVAHDAVFLSVALDDFQQRAALTVGHIVDGHLFATAGDVLVVTLEDGYELADEGLAAQEDALALVCHLLLPEAEHFSVGFFLLLEHGVALLQRLVVTADRLHIGAVVLRDDEVHEPASLLAAAVDEEGVGGRYHHQGDEADMLGEAAVLLLVAAEMLLRTALHAAGDGCGVGLILP